MSFVPSTALDPLVEIAEATLEHVVQLQREVSVHEPGMKYRKSWVDFGSPLPGLLVPAAAGGANVRADQPSVAGDWTLKLERSAVVDSTMRARVSGVDESGHAWTRLMAVRKALVPQANEVLRDVLVVDVEANPET